MNKINPARANKFNLTILSNAVSAFLPLVPIGPEDDPDQVINLAAIIHAERIITPQGDRLSIHMADGLSIDLTVEEAINFQSRLLVALQIAQSQQAQAAGKRLGIIP